MSDGDQTQLSIESRIQSLASLLEKANSEVREWTDTNARLSQSAAEARAKNQGYGKGLMGALLGSKYRAAMRRAASASNADIAKDVAAKRAQIAEGKRQAQERVRTIQAELKEAKSELKAYISEKKKNTVKKKTATKEKSSAIDLLHKLKEAHDLGLLTDEEYESKRKALAEKI